MPIKKVLSYGLKPVKIWTNDIDSNSEQQLANIAQLPFIHKHVAAMPDVHLGKGATIGSVIATNGAVIPAAVGVDIGCGMMAQRTSLTASDLPDNLFKLRSDIERSVPHGGPGKHGSWLEQGRYGIPNKVTNFWTAGFKDEFNYLISKYPKLEHGATLDQLGTLGGGNHFIEICLDEMQNVWVMLHSGSRGVGNRIGVHFIDKAKREMERYHIGSYLPDKDLSYLVEHTEIYDDYIHAVEWAQRFAAASREIMMDNILKVLTKTFGSYKLDKVAINCHHNYISRENHFNATVIVTRKGAIRARNGDLGIIPGSMGAKSFIVMGKGNKDSFTSCSHGAGRTMSRTAAKRKFTTKDLEAQTKGIECPKDQARVDEIPAAYKDIDTVMDNQSDLVTILHTLKQVVNVKG